MEFSFRRNENYDKTSILVFISSLLVLVSDEMKTNIDVLSFGKELKVKLGIVNNK